MTSHRPVLEILEDRTVPSALSQTQLLQSYGQIPLSFEINQGQTDPQVNFLSHGNGYGLFLMPTEAVLSLQKPCSGANTLGTQTGGFGSLVVPPLGGPLSPPEGGTTNLDASPPDVLRMQLVGANATSPGIGLDQLPGVSNYFIGSDPSKWHTNIPNYGQVEYQNVYPGINLIYYGNQRQLEYDFDVAPGADPGVITLRFQGQHGLALDAQGDLIIRTAGGDVVEHAPLVYQEVGGVREPVSGRYVLEATDRVGFAVGPYDASKPLTIDPVLSYSTYLGGSSGDLGYGIAVDSSGNAYVTGFTTSTNFPTTAAAFQTTLGTSIGNAFVTKLNSSGTALVYSTYLGGSSGDVGYGIVVDGTGNAYVTGNTSSANFPTTAGAFQTTLRGVFGNAFVTKLNSSGTALVYSTYLGGNNYDSGQAVVVDGAGNAYVAGQTSSTNFPTTVGALQTAQKGTYNAFVTELNGNGTALVYSTYLGGSGFDYGYGLAVDTSGNAYVTGQTRSTDFPTTPGAFQTTLAGSQDAFVTKLNATGTALVYSTYLGGSSEPVASGIAVDSSGNVYLAGVAGSNFPTTPGAFQTTLAGSQNAFVTKLNATGTALVFSTYLGGSGGDGGQAIAVDSAGDAYVTGSTGSNFPTTVGAFETTFGGGTSDAFVTELNASGTALLYSSYLGGSGSDVGRGIAVDGAGNAYLTGNSGSTNFPTTQGSFQTTLGGSDNAFIAKFELAPAAAKTLRVAGFPSPTTAGVAQSFTVTALDANGNIATSYTGTVHFTSTDKKAVLPANYTFSASDAGVHTFSATLETAGTQAITAKDMLKSTISGSESGITVNPAATSHFKVSVPASSTAGVAFSITVTALDPYGNITPNYMGTVHLTSSDKKAVLPANYCFTATDGGIHVFSNGVILKTAGSQTVTATDTVTATITGKSAAIKVSAAAVDHFNIKAVVSTTAGTAFSITVMAQDAFNNAVTNYLGTIHFTSSDLQAVLPADYTFTATDKGVHTFTGGVILKTAGTQTVTVTDKSNSTLTDSVSIKVVAATASTLRINAPASVTHGVPFTFTVTVLDAFGNVVKGYTGTVHFTSSDGAASLPANYKFTSSDAGVHTFSATLNTTGSQSLTATDTVTASITGTDPTIQVD